MTYFELGGFNLPFATRYSASFCLRNSVNRQNIWFHQIVYIWRFRFTQPVCWATVWYDSITSMYSGQEKKNDNSVKV